MKAGHCVTIQYCAIVTGSWENNKTNVTLFHHGNKLLFFSQPNCAFNIEILECVCLLEIGMIYKTRTKFVSVGEWAITKCKVFLLYLNIFFKLKQLCIIAVVLLFRYPFYFGIGHLCWEMWAVFKTGCSPPFYSALLTSSTTKTGHFIHGDPTVY